ncbi:hypothetical protein LCGC14_1751250 [marine sediment metagenome]|uniref:Uncharacterized protein n=1 Tax=marine sediment metagenome TaxID=412755 RepID=A0A0F9JIV2_9ZZZZ
MMIRSCEDVKTLDEFAEWITFRANVLRMGLDETAEMLCWDSGNLICPELFEDLFEKETLR